MKKITAQLFAHLASPVTSLCYCWKLKLRNGKEFGFTDCDRDIMIDGLEYIANSGFSPSAISSSSSLAVDNLDIDGMLDNQIIKEEDILSGVYDYAEIEIFLVNYNDILAGKLNLRRGWFGEISFSKNRFVTEVRGLMQAFAKNIGELYSPNCRASFCDSACKLKVEQFTDAGTVKWVINKSRFIVVGLDKINGFYNNGIIKFKDGETVEIKSYFNNEIETVLPVYKEVSIGQGFEITAGCDKVLTTCINKFDNAINFRGEPHVPGLDKLSLF